MVFGGQVMVHARVRINEGREPMEIEYLNLKGGHKGRVSLGIMDWVGEDARFLMAAPGQPRPGSFAQAKGEGRTLSRWRRK